MSDRAGPDVQLTKVELRLCGAAIAFAGAEFCEARGLEDVGDLLLKLDRLREEAPDPPESKPAAAGPEAPE